LKKPFVVLNCPRVSEICTPNKQTLDYQNGKTLTLKQVLATAEVEKTLYRKQIQLHTWKRRAI